MTNAIGKGTVNVSVNMPHDESQIWGRLFGQSDKKSKGEFLKDALLDWAKQNHPEQAARIAEIRQRRAALVALLIFLTMTIAPLITSTKKAFKDVRRVASVRTVRNVRTGRFDFVEA